MQRLGGRLPVIAGTGGASTTQAVERTRAACELGADGVLVVTPYYNRPPQEGLYRHFSVVADAASVPLILYNVPSRTACDLLPETVERLSGHPQVIGIKEATGSVARGREILERCGDDFQRSGQGRRGEHDRSRTAECRPGGPAGGQEPRRGEGRACHAPGPARCRAGDPVHGPYRVWPAGRHAGHRAYGDTVRFRGRHPAVGSAPVVVSAHAVTSASRGFIVEHLLLVGR